MTKWITEETKFEKEERQKKKWKKEELIKFKKIKYIYRNLKEEMISKRI